jgi:hypothetical protein
LHGYKGISNLRINQKGEGEKLSVLACGHFTCAKCIADLIAHSPKCPSCRVPINVKHGQVMTVTIRDPDMTVPMNDEAESRVNLEKYGSKISAFVKFTEQTLASNVDAKIILFIQFSRFVSYAFYRSD